MTDERSQAWLERAAADLTASDILVREVFTAHGCFLAHQAFEKSLKAYLINSRNSYPRSHKLVDLVRECATHNSVFSDLLDNAIVLDQYYIPTRYPDATPGTLPDRLPDMQHAKEAIRSAQGAYQLVTTLLYV